VFENVQSRFRILYKRSMTPSRGQSRCWQAPAAATATSSATLFATAADTWTGRGAYQSTNGAARTAQERLGTCFLDRYNL